MRRSRSAAIAFTFALGGGARADRWRERRRNRACRCVRSSSSRRGSGGRRSPPTGPRSTSRRTASILGIERVYDQLGKRDSILPLIDSLITKHPREPMLRTVQLRTLAYLHRDERGRRRVRAVGAARARATPSPYREYARLLLDDGRVGERRYRAAARAARVRRNEGHHGRDGAAPRRDRALGALGAELARGHG